MILYRGHRYRATTRQARTIHDLTPEYLQVMQKNDWVRVFHGTFFNRDSTSGAQNMVFGIDATEQHRSNHHPGAYDYTGLYVAPTRAGTGQFGGGGLVFEFTVQAKTLHDTDWSARQEQDDGYYDAEYPGSFYPALTHGLLPERYEPQALFLGVVPASDILAVHTGNQVHTPQEFIDQYQDDLGWSSAPSSDPKLLLQWDQYAEIVQDRFGVSMDKVAQHLCSTFQKSGMDGSSGVYYQLHRIAPFSRASADHFWSMIQERYCQ